MSRRAAFLPALLAFALAAPLPALAGDPSATPATGEEPVATPALLAAALEDACKSASAAAAHVKSVDGLQAETEVVDGRKGGNSVAMETLVIAHEGMELDALPATFELAVARALLAAELEPICRDALALSAALAERSAGDLAARSRP